MTSVGYISQPTLEEFGSPEPYDDESPESGCWYDPRWLMDALLSGEFHLKDRHLQRSFIKWVKKEEVSEFYNLRTAEMIYIPVPKRGNMAYVMNKASRRNEMIKAISDKVFDWPDPCNPALRWTRMLFVTVTFDPKRFTQEEAWASIKSTGSRERHHLYGEINRLDANLSKIFGPHGKLLCKEAQSNGYPAPHMILVLDEPIQVRMINGKRGVKWVPVDETILRRIGTDPESRALCETDYSAGIDANPIWKNGFIDFEGIVSESRFRGRRSVVSYPFKYLTKCLTRDDAFSASDIECIDDVKDPKLRTALYTHYCNKCFRNRDITYGKGFRDRIGLLPPKKKEVVLDENGKSVKSDWIRIGSVDRNEFLLSGRPHRLPGHLPDGPSGVYEP